MTTPPWTPICVAQIKTFLMALFFWEPNPVRVGKIVRFVHGLIIASWLGLYVLSHTIFPSFLFVCVVYGLFIAIWAQHMFFGGCILSFVERSLIGDETTLVADTLLDLFDIRVSPDSFSNSVNGIVCLCFTVGACLLTFELLARMRLSWLSKRSAHLNSLRIVSECISNSAS